MSSLTYPNNDKFRKFSYLVKQEESNESPARTNKRKRMADKGTDAVKNDGEPHSRKRKLPSESTSNPPRRSLRTRR